MASFAVVVIDPGCNPGPGLSATVAKSSSGAARRWSARIRSPWPPSAEACWSAERCCEAPRDAPRQTRPGSKYRCINPRASVVAQQFRDDLHAAEAGEAALPEPIPLGRTSPTPPDTPTHASMYSWAAARTARPAGRNSGPTRRWMSTRSKPTLVHQSVRLMVALLGGPGARARR